jgi:predicted protein tyrosine phosphatase
MKYIFVCNYGINRSPTGARVAREMGLEREIDLKTEHMALFPEETPEYEEKDRKRLEDSDKIFVMTSDIQEIVRKRYKVPNGDMICLDIEDNYSLSGLAGPRMKRMLEEIFRKKLDEWIK